ncbi:hypothetical protein BU24DRAFT_404937 [Aaosphaeria arxii CBS 175.79]|uniref:Uncharacterized protein n=1 Tax=Aaosphaeria arxii CBS 175.79 TaxID=1450172 RepID=A0A6A5YBD1_9PLEO|nr:uncharacterized protein BU24DRAFT_404937 [Aaosphaeria arxii CBS 175.79]KAF2022011.1 hypothetical protein BU24DRAFT_404937 [Aaosphaeria arxii CBS 175.79]
MAPLRRYLRITKHSVLEVRIYLDRPSDAESWLLKRDNPALPRIIEAIRPYVLPKLREENERVRGKGSKTKKKGVKDVVIEDDFEVSIFLTDLSSRHSVLTKQKMFKDRPRIQSNSGKLTGWLKPGTSDQPVVINDSTDPVIVREEEDDSVINLDDIPEANTSNPGSRTRRGREIPSDVPDEADDAYNSDTSEPVLDDKKKLGMKTSYDGFSIYGRILCLVVKRKGPRNTAGTVPPASNQQMMENWVSTQAAAEQVDDDDNA